MELIVQRPTSPASQYRSKLLNGQFEIQRCISCGSYVFYPRMFCPDCGADSLEWTTPSGRGVIYSTTVVRRSDDKGGPYGVVLVDLEEGVRLMSTVIDVDPASVRIGDPVLLQVAMVRGEPAPVCIQVSSGTHSE